MFVLCNLRPQLIRLGVDTWFGATNHKLAGVIRSPTETKELRERDSVVDGVLNWKVIRLFSGGMRGPRISLCPQHASCCLLVAWQDCMSSLDVCLRACLLYSYSYHFPLFMQKGMAPVHCNQTRSIRTTALQLGYLCFWSSDGNVLIYNRIFMEYFKIAM